ncbi:MAG TPA: DUF4215 domain-containing protein [Polyangiaceae bacterium]|nr:DUF4215 domain-containing protein [Polyangiaceae bacterium]
MRRLVLALIGLGAACGSVDTRPLTTTPDTPSGSGGMTAAGAGKAGSQKAGQGGGSGRGGSGATPGQAGVESGGGGASGSETCGNGVREGEEECDDGNVTSGDGCSSDCVIEASGARCGDGIIEGNEECDDGNLQVGDGCDDQCRIERCGNGRVDAGEQCDPPAAGSCTIDCTLVLMDCGDGKVEANEGEQCDDGNDKAGDGCFDCRFECGDGKIDASIGEQCEPEYSPTLCSNDCKWLPVCGDGIVDTSLGEECDPSNGTTCVDCKKVTPGDCGDGAGGGGGAGGCSEVGCVPDASSDLVVNGGFASDTSAWSPGAPSVHLALVADGYPTPEALEVTFDSGPVRAESGAAQCVPIAGGRRYDLQAAYRIPTDAPDGVGAAVLGMLFQGAGCTGTMTGTPSLGPEGLTRGAWTQYSYTIDTTALPDDGSAASLLLRLDVVRPANVDGSRVDWDSVSLNQPGARCGDCKLDPGEQCDDGNRVSGDGCSATCQLEICGDGVKSPSEMCDDGNTTFLAGDTCTPGCRTPNACDTCAEGQCTSALDACFGLTGDAQAGPKTGIARSSLCDDLLTCVRTTDCDLAVRTTEGVTGAFIENCYCGTSGAHCFDGAAAPNGSCLAEVEAALESTNPNEIAGRLDGSNTDYPIVGLVRDLLACEGTSCTTDCDRTPSCGDGRIEDRDLTTFTANGEQVQCVDATTASGHGCSVEECDSGNPAGSATCDQNCFLVVCGNGIVQGDEQCDDGNRISGDGCSADCKAEYKCGDGVVTASFEDCDPPGSGGTDDCSLDEAESSPADCACDSKCKYAVCGNGVVQAPYEDCDPPDGATCGSDCKAVGKTACETCIDANTTADYFQAGYCDPDPLCLLVERCVIETKCFNPLPAFCYCGITDSSTNTTDVGVCKQASYTATGPCVTEIKNGMAPAGITSNSDINDNLFKFSNSSGAAMGTLNATFAHAPECESTCF